jgi:adenosylhomocysteine nucleosidase
MPRDFIKDIEGKHVLYVMAASQEYGPHLQACFHPLITGVGPVESALHVSRALAILEETGRLPDLVVCLGSAGSRLLEQTRVYQVATASYRDMDASPLGFEKGITPFLEQPPAIEFPYHIPGLPEATISTGGAIITGDAYKDIAEDMVDMETYAVLRACMIFNVNMVGLRGISDGAKELRHVDDWTEYLHVVDENLADAVELLEAALRNGTLES